VEHLLDTCYPGKRRHNGKNFSLCESGSVIRSFQLLRISRPLPVMSTIPTEGGQVLRVRNLKIIKGCVSDCGCKALDFRVQLERTAEEAI
jgi:hypothetical protein